MPEVSDSDDEVDNTKKMKNVAKLRKKDVRASDSDMSESENDSEDDVFASQRGGDGDDGYRSGKLSIMQMVKRGLRDAGKAFKRAFVDYGPPYKIHKDGIELEPCPVVDCCADMNMSYVKLHRLLNDHMDPNIPDDQDFYMTGMHYCGRYLHYLGARMLLRAGGKINVVNEWGQTPLILCVENVIADAFDPRKHTQIKMLNWLIENGANVRHRDKGGFEALDFACMNNNLEIIQILINNGATFRRTNDTLVAKRQSILDFISDPECYNFVLKAYTKEENEYQIKNGQRLKEKVEREHDIAAAKNLASLSKRKSDKIKKQQEALAFERKLYREQARKKTIENAMNSLTKGKKLKDQEYGEWVPDEAKNWKWESRAAVKNADEVSKRIHSEAVSKMQNLHKNNRKKLYDKRWEAMGGSGKIEVPWKRDSAFYMEGVTQQYSDDSDNIGSDQDETLGERDENDDLLDGEDLSDALSILSGDLSHK